MLKVTIRTFLSQNLWVVKTIQDALKPCNATHNTGLANCNMDKHKAAFYKFCRAVKKSNQCYGKKVELQLQQSGSRGLWHGLQSIMNYKAIPMSMGIWTSLRPMN